MSNQNFFVLPFPRQYFQYAVFHDIDIIVQVIIEFRDDRSIQFLDLWEDTFVTPQKRSVKFLDLMDTLARKLESLSSLLDKDGHLNEPTKQIVEELAEEAVFTVEDIKKQHRTVNRHIQLDTATNNQYKSFHALHHQMTKLYDVIPMEDQSHLIPAEIKKAKDLLDECRKNLASNSYVFLVAKHFFKHTVFSQTYLRKYEKEMEESSIFANTFRPIMQFIRFAVLHDGGEKAVVGEDGWLFYKPGVDYLVRPYMLDQRSMTVDPNDKPLVDDPIQAILHFEKQLKDLGIQLLVVIVPGKPSIYPEMIYSDFDREKIPNISHSLRAIKELSGKGIDVVDLFHPFLREKQKDKELGGSLYLKQDTHWKARGLRLTAKSVADRIKQYPWFHSASDSAEYIMETVYVERQGDVGFMTKLPDFKIRGLQMHFPVEKTKCYQVYSIKRDADGNEISRRLYKDNFRKAEILVLGDSFSRIYQADAPRSAGWISHLAFELSRPLASIVSDGGASTLVREKLARKSKVLKGKKLVVWEFVERDFRFGAKGWKDVSIGF